MRWICQERPGAGGHKCVDHCKIESSVGTKVHGRAIVERTVLAHERLPTWLGNQLSGRLASDKLFSHPRFDRLVYSRAPAFVQVTTSEIFEVLFMLTCPGIL